MPDPRDVGPTMIQIGNDGGLLPQAATHLPTPRSASSSGCPPTGGGDGRVPVGHRASRAKALYLAPGERADVIVDFSEVPAGSKLILYNDAPAPAPNGDSRVDYYTGDVDQTAIGGAPTTLAGYGPNTRTVMQFQVDGPAAAPFDLERLQRALPAAYAAAQDPVLVPSPEYDAAYGPRPRGGGAAGASPEAAQPSACRGGGRGHAGRHAGDAGPAGGRSRRARRNPAPSRSRPWAAATGSRSPCRARWSATCSTRPTGADGHPRRRRPALGERRAHGGARTRPSTRPPSTSRWTQEATAPQIGDATQMWRITHDGTTSHSVSFGGFDVQVLARARRDGETRAPDPGELGWKDTLRVDPLESVLIAVRPVLPQSCPSSCRPARARSTSRCRSGAEGAFTQLDPITAAPLAREVVNAAADLSFEARWSIHLIGGEESHTARPLVLQGTTVAPAGLTATAGEGAAVELAWTPPLFPPPVTGYVVERAADEEFTADSRPSRRTPTPRPTPTRPRRAGAPTSTASAPRPPPAGRRGRRRPRSACPDVRRGGLRGPRAATMTDEAEAGEGASEPAADADGRRRGDRHPRRPHARPRRLRAAAARPARRIAFASPPPPPPSGALSVLALYSSPTSTCTSRS